MKLARRLRASTGTGRQMPEVRKEEADMNADDALALARNLKYGPLPKPGDPTPSVDEAIVIISEERRTCWFNWLTGEAAEKVLREQKK